MDDPAAQVQRDLAGEHHGVGPDGDQQLVGEQPLHGSAGSRRVGQGPPGVVEPTVRRSPGQVVESLERAVGRLGQQGGQPARAARAAASRSCVAAIAAPEPGWRRPERLDDRADQAQVVVGPEDQGEGASSYDHSLHRLGRRLGEGGEHG